VQLVHHYSGPLKQDADNPEKTSGARKVWRTLTQRAAAASINVAYRLFAHVLAYGLRFAWSAREGPRGAMLPGSASRC
jgi:hypothetical protein